MLLSVKSPVNLPWRILWIPRRKPSPNTKGLQMPSQLSGEGVPGLSGRYTMEWLGQSLLSYRWWTCRAQRGEALTKRGVKVRSWGELGWWRWRGGIDSPCINSTWRLCHSSGYTSSLRNAASLQSKHGVTSSALTQGALRNGGVVKTKGQLPILLTGWPAEVNEGGWRSSVKEILKMHATCTKYTFLSKSQVIKGQCC